MSTSDIAQELLAWLDTRHAEMLALLRAWVECESPSREPARVAACGELVARAFTAAGCRHEPAAGAVEMIYGGGDEAGELLLLGHLDTVYPAGTLASMPFRVTAGAVHGPGVLDMKGGLTMALFALRALAALGLRPRRTCRLLFVGDEETGSAGSRPLTETRARGARAVLVLEPGAGTQGALKTRRKGIARYTLRARGLAAHAGVDFWAGASAIAELARQVAEVAGWSDRERGITINAGTITGGTAANVVAAAAAVEFDVRAPAGADLEAVAQRLRGLRAHDTRVGLELEGGINRPPMEPGPGTAPLLALAHACGRRVGLALEESATGGGSDGNFTAALGVPTLDGLGVAGGGAHSPDEFFRLDTWAPRTALLALLLAEA